LKTIFLIVLVSFLGYPQGYTSYFTGNPTNITTTPEFGVCKMGGATEHDNAMRWLLQKANGGDVVVLHSHQHQEQVHLLVAHWQLIK